MGVTLEPIPQKLLGPKVRQVELEGRVYRVLAGKRGKPGEIIICRKDGLRHRGGAVLCLGRSRQRLNPLEFRQTLGDGVDADLLELPSWQFRQLTRAADRDPRHFAPCERHPRTGRTKCRYHGGRQLVGSAHPAAGTLESSVYAPEGRIGRHVQAFLAGLSPLDVAQEIALYRGLLEESIRPALEDGESVPVFDEVARLARDLNRALDAGDEDGARRVSRELRSLTNGRGRAMAAVELTKHGNAIAKLVRVQIQRRKTLDQMVTPQDLDAFEIRVVSAMRRMVRAVSEELPPDHPARAALRMALSEAQRDIASARPQLIDVGGDE